MPTETPRPKQTTKPEGTETAQDFMSDMWDKTMNMQREWLGIWSRPFGTTPTGTTTMPTPEQMLHELHKFNKECLDLTRKTSELTHGFVNDQVKIGKEFADKAVDLTKDTDLRDSKDTTPKLAHEWFDTTRRCAKRTMSFGNDSLKTFEEFGLNFSETMMRTPTEAK